MKRHDAISRDGTCGGARTFAATAYINYVSLVDAYGSGPPYYGRTTNMDKWSSPLWGLLMIDGVVLLMVLAAVQLFCAARPKRARLRCPRAQTRSGQRYRGQRRRSTEIG